jgi:hypothetical protein
MFVLRKVNEEYALLHKNRRHPFCRQRRDIFSLNSPASGCQAFRHCRKGYPYILRNLNPQNQLKMRIIYASRFVSLANSHTVKKKPPSWTAAE